MGIGVCGALATIGAYRITCTILGVPYHNYSCSRRLPIIKPVMGFGDPGVSSGPCQAEGSGGDAKMRRRAFGPNVHGASVPRDVAQRFRTLGTLDLQFDNLKQTPQTHKSQAPVKPGSSSCNLQASGACNRKHRSKKLAVNPQSRTPHSLNSVL